MIQLMGSRLRSRAVMSAAFDGRLSGSVKAVMLSLKLCKKQIEKPFIITHWTPPLSLRDGRNTLASAVPKRQFWPSVFPYGDKSPDFQIPLKSLPPTRHTPD